MRAIVQRVSSASVTVDGKVISSIAKGLMVLVGISRDDTPADSEIIANKILNIKAFDGHDGTMWKSSVKDVEGSIMCVSQFTLYANTTKGNKPDFHNAMGAATSQEMYSAFLQRLRTLYIPERIQDGKFGAMMSVQLTNEGPVTLTLDSRKFEYVQNKVNNEVKLARTLTYTKAPDDDVSKA